MKLNLKLFLYYSLLFIITMAIVTVFQYRREKNFRLQQLNSRVGAYSDIIYHNYLLADSNLNALVKLLPDTAIRVTMMDSLGNVFFDTYSDSAYKENHLSRPEIMALKHAGSAYDIRMSATNGIDYYYYAQKYDNLFIRLALPYNISVVSALKANLHFFYVFAILLIVMMMAIAFISNVLYVSVKNNETRLKRQLTQNVSHELKTPVAAVLGYMESLVDNPNLSAEQKDYFINKAYLQSKRLSTLLQDISTLNKMDDSKKLYEKEQVDLVNIIYDVLRDTEDAAKEKHDEVIVNLPPDLMLNGNKSLLYSIFRNLMDNAIAYAGEGVTIRIAMTYSDPQYYNFIFKDNGTGVGEEHLPRIFERFYRVDKGRSRKLGGTGLGLAIVKNAVLLHGGTIEVRNCSDGGLEFFFSIHK